MRRVDLPPALYRELMPVEVGHYLHRSGWKSRPFREGLQRFSRDGVEVTVPTQRAGDTAEVLANMFRTLSTVEGRDAYDIALQMMAASDLIRLRVISKVTSQGDMPIAVFDKLIGSFRGLLRSAAYAELSGTKVTTRSREATQMANHTRVGQTDVGSFVLTFLVPLDGTPGSTDIPMRRRMTSRVMRGARDTEEATTADDLAPIMDSADGLSADMCDALANVMVVGDTEFTAAFDPGWRMEGTGCEPTAARLRARKAVPTVREAATLLRGGAPMFSEPTEIRAHVVGVHWTGQHKIPKEDPRVNFLLMTGDRVGIVEASATVSEDDYWLAVAALKDDIPVMLTGSLGRKTKSKRSPWLIWDPRDLRLMPDLERIATEAQEP